jgi:hypothetical protein
MKLKADAGKKKFVESCGCFSAVGVRAGGFAGPPGAEGAGARGFGWGVWVCGCVGVWVGAALARDLLERAEIQSRNTKIYMLFRRGPHAHNRAARRSRPSKNIS